jgi:hypothetical protein
MVHREIAPNTAEQKEEPTKGLLDELKENVENGDTAEMLNSLKENVLDQTLFSAKTEDGKILDSITVRDIYENPYELIRGIGLLVADSFTMTQGLYTWIFLGKSPLESLNEERDQVEEISPVADDYYIRSKSLDVSEFQGETEETIDQLNQIVEMEGPNPERIKNLYEEQTEINKQMDFGEFVDLMHKLTLACEDYDLEKDVYLPYFMGLAHKESSFRKMAWNSSGATGYFQHMTHFIDDRIEDVAGVMRKRKLLADERIVEDAKDQFSKTNNEGRKDRSSWPDGVEEFAFGNSLQSYMTAELTKDNLKSISKYMSEEQLNSSELYEFLYLAHNMGAGRARKILKGESLDSWGVERLKNLQKKKIISKVRDFALSSRKTLYGNKQTNIV